MKKPDLLGKALGYVTGLYLGAVFVVEVVKEHRAEKKKKKGGK